jgi:hypothetical protein
MVLAVGEYVLVEAAEAHHGSACGAAAINLSGSSMGPVDPVANLSDEGTVSGATRQCNVDVPRTRQAAYASGSDDRCLLLEVKAV